MKSADPINLPREIPLWPQGAPQAGPEDLHLPRFTYYLPSAEYRTGQSVLVLPGGGYGMVSTPKEGHRPAQVLATHGIAAAVLEYRHSPQRYPVPLLDAQRGLRLLRSLAAEQQDLNPDAVGVMGFSAGGHLCGLLSTQEALPLQGEPDDLDSLPSAPNFSIYIYPVVSMTQPFSHFGSRDNLLGEDADPDLAKRFSIENAISDTSPPALIIHAQNDRGVPVENALALYQAYTDHKIPAAMHLYPIGGHGFGLAANHSWGQRMLDWLSDLAKEA